VGCEVGGLIDSAHLLRSYLDGLSPCMSWQDAIHLMIARFKRGVIQDSTSKTDIYKIPMSKLLDVK
jgi:hypothetical protein